MTRVLEPVPCAACGRAVILESWASDLCLVTPAGRHRVTGEGLLVLAMRRRLENSEGEELENRR